MWKQTNTNIQLVLNHDLTPEQFKDIDVEFTDTGVIVKYPGNM